MRRLCAERRLTRWRAVFCKEEQVWACRAAANVALVGKPLARRAYWGYQTPLIPQTQGVKA